MPFVKRDGQCFQRSAERRRFIGQCASVFAPEKLRCMRAEGHRGLHSADGAPGWMDPEIDQNFLKLQGVEKAIAAGDEAFSELLGEGIIKP